MQTVKNMFNFMKDWEAFFTKSLIILVKFNSLKSAQNALTVHFARKSFLAGYIIIKWNPVYFSIPLFVVRNVTSNRIGENSESYILSKTANWKLCLKTTHGELECSAFKILQTHLVLHYINLIPYIETTQLYLPN